MIQLLEMEQELCFKFLTSLFFFRDMQFLRRVVMVTGLLFMPKDEKRVAEIESAIAVIAKGEGLELLGIRDVPVDNSMLGEGLWPQSQ